MSLIQKMSPSSSSSAFLLVVLLVQATHFSLGAITGSETYVFDFTNDMEGWLSYRGSWRWSDRSNLTHQVPANSLDNGFALMDTFRNSDELYTPYVSAPFGASFSMKFFIRSELEASNTMFVDMLEEGEKPVQVLDLTNFSSPQAESWLEASVEIPAREKDVLLAVFCYNGNAKPDNGTLMYGCAIDQIKITIHDQIQTTVTQDSTTDAP